MQYNPAMPAPSLLSPLLSALNTLLATQPDARARLAAHAGRVIRLALPGAAVDLTLDEGGAFRAAPAEAAPDLTLTPDPAALPRCLSGGSLNDLFRIQGDGTLGSDLAAALAGFDWVLALRPWLGDLAAARVDQFFREFSRWGRGAAESAGRNLAEYAVHEQALLADPLAIRGFVAEVDALREAADRLEARLKLLEGRRPI
ncbi:MAG: SCP2 sterol-binding domain-containing protein [Pseudomonadota bacterium]